ncbi:LON peptidase N-terminal domain and RING finger protein 3 [Melipona quadrifasciata]|uniref:LON peptidase N-terminal domain and RING finger protein 3 n=1 Tax=Melipona quadrifasciata TaxID=166423 RepID=A0A0M8ZZ96_9HYME|nr:LON peptidase N-terminal domain and RING finger protein 3 [Melipona quadrifasciata]
MGSLKAGLLHGNTNCYTLLPLATRNAEDKLEKERAVNLKQDAILSDWLAGTNESTFSGSNNLDALSLFCCLIANECGHYRRGVALSALGRHEEALFALCISVAIDKNPQAVRHELIKVLYNVLSSGYRRYGLPFRTPYNLTEGASRTRSRHQLMNPKRNRRAALNASDCEDNSSGGEEDFTQHERQCNCNGEKKKHAKRNIEKLGFEQILGLRNDPLNVTQDPDVSLRIKMNCISKKRSSNRVNPNNLRLKFALNPIMLVGSLQTVSRRLLLTIAPQNNMKLQAGLDRLYQDIEKLKRLEARPAEILLPPLSGGTAGELDCILCCRLLWKPVTTPCGHTYCWMCLDRCLDYSSACPLCVTSLADVRITLDHFNQQFVKSSDIKILFLAHPLYVLSSLELVNQYQYILAHARFILTRCCVTSTKESCGKLTRDYVPWDKRTSEHETPVHK